MRTQIISFFLVMAMLAFNAATGQAQDSGLRGPVMGYVLDATLQAVRPVNGIPGSSLLGDPLSLPFPVTAAAFSPRGDFGIVVSAADGVAYMLRNPGGELSVELIAGGISYADRLYFNTDASAAVLLSSNPRQFQVLRGIPGSATTGLPVDISSIPGTISSLAIDQAASNILIGISDNYGSLYLASNDPQTSPRLIASFGSPTALALLNGDQDVIVADAGLNELTLIRDFAGVPQVFRLAGEQDGVASPTGLRLSADSRKLYIASAATRTLDVWNLESYGLEARHPLDAAPTGLTPLQGTSTFVLNEVGNHPLVLVDAAVNLDVYFVPAGGDR